MPHAAPADPPALQLSRWLPYRLFIVAARIARPLQSYYGERFELSQPAWRILATIAERAEASASEIAHACALDAFSVSRGIAQLVQRGYAVRGRARADRRRAAVSITAAGRQVFDDIARLGRAIEDALLVEVDTAQRAVLDTLLQRLDAASTQIEAGGWPALLPQAGR